MKIDGKKLTYQLNGPQILALAAIEGRHPKALSYEMTRASMATLVRLAYGEHAPEPLADVPAWLASLAYDEIERRQGALARLAADMNIFFAHNKGA